MTNPAKNYPDVEPQADYPRLEAAVLQQLQTQHTFQASIDARAPGLARSQPTSSLPELAARYDGVDDYTDLLLLP